jgi:CcmD family protein
MTYLALGFGVVWVCHLTYLLVLDSQARQLRRRLDSRAPAAPDATHAG